MLISYFYFLSVLRPRSSSHLLSCPRPFPLSLLMCALIGCFEPRIPINWTFQVAWRRFSWCASTYPRARPPAAESNVDQTQSTEEKQLTFVVTETTKQTHLTLVSLIVLFFFKPNRRLLRGGGTLFFWRLFACFVR